MPNLSLPTLSTPTLSTPILFKSHLRRTLATCLAAAAFVAGPALMTGCSGQTKAGTTYEVNPGGALEVYFQAPLADVHDAAKRSVGNTLKFNIISTSSDSVEGLVEAKTAGGKDVKVYSERSSASLTKLTVMVGVPVVAVDKNMAETVLNVIERELGVSAQ